MSVWDKLKGGGKSHPRTEVRFPMPVTVAALEEIFSGCDDFAVRPLYVGGDRRDNAAVCFVDGLVSGVAISEDVIRPLTEAERLSTARTASECIELVRHGAVYCASMNERTAMDDVVNDLVSGFCAVIFDRENTALTFETRSGEHRSISEPMVEKAVKGSKDSFVEMLRINTMLVRRKLKNPALKVKQTVVGRQTRTDVAVLYVEGIANPEVVAEMERRLDGIDVDGLLTTGVIEEYVIDCPASPFPQLLHTERSDNFCSHLLKGRVGVIADGIPMGFLVPGAFAAFMEAPEDNATHFIPASAITLLRYLSMVLSLLLPSMYVAIAIYHQEMIPTKLLLSIIESKQGIPFSTAAETISMLIAFELLQEAGLRLPNPIGQTVSIIGALIVGQSAVEANVISPIAVIVVAFAGIAGFTLPDQDLASVLRLARFVMTIAAMLAGIFGIMGVGILLVYHLCALESFGTAYMAPIAGNRRAGGLLKSLLRLPLRSVKYREEQLRTPNKRKQA